MRELLKGEEADTPRRASVPTRAFLDIMTQDASVRARRAAHELWMTHHGLQDVGSGDDYVQERKVPEDSVLQVVAERIQDKCDLFEFRSVSHIWQYVYDEAHMRMAQAHS